ncbi:MAG: DUF3488 domain-containing protein [Proteobacteria bacterium]|nr:DUF3488 domain-containing protein [Pseudomonadota bacterium]
MMAQGLTVRLAALAGLWGLSLAPQSAEVALAGMVGMLVGPAVLKRIPTPVTAPGSAALLIGVAAAGSLGVVSSSGALAAALAYLLVFFAASPGRRAQRLTLLVSVLLLARGGSASQDIGFLGAFALWAAVIPGALAATSPGAASVRWSIRVTPAVLAVAWALFWMLPRPAGSPSLALDGPVSVTGFSDSVELGQMGPMLSDPTTVLRMRVDTLADVTFPETVYVRGTVLDHFDGVRWRATAPLEAEVTTAPVAKGVRVEMIQSGAEAGVLYTLGAVRRVEGVEAQTDAAGNWRVPPQSGALAWTVWSSAPFDLGARPHFLEEVERRRALQLPELDPRIQQAAADLGEGDAVVLARAARRWLQEQVQYTRSSEAIAGGDPLSTVLFERREGHCEYFASAAAVLLRARGVPTRVVNGFVSSEQNQVGGYRVVRAAHAHSWVEVYDGLAWVEVDPTPGPGQVPERAAGSEVYDALKVLWMERVVGFDGGQQRRAVATIGQSVGDLTGARGSVSTSIGWALLVGLGTAGLVVVRPWVSRWLGRLAGESGARPAGRVAGAWHSAARAAESRTGTPPPALPPLSAAQWWEERGDPAGSAMVELAWLHYRVSFGGEDDATLAEAADALATRAKAAVPG